MPRRRMDLPPVTGVATWPLRVCDGCGQAWPERPDYYRLRVDTRAKGRPLTFAPVCRACERAQGRDRVARRRALEAAKVRAVAPPPLPPPPANAGTRFDRVLAALEAEVGPYATWRGERYHWELSRRLRADAGLPPYPPLTEHEG